VSVTKVSAALMEAGTKGADIASTGTMVIGTDGSYFDITGTTGITAMTVDVGRIFTLQFDGAVVLTHSSTLYLAGAANFTTEANDHLTFVAVAANDVRQIGAGLKDGGSPVAAGGGAWNYITTSSITGSPSTVTLSGITSAYDTYVLTYANIRVSDDGAMLGLRYGDSGGVDSGSTDYGINRHITFGNNSNNVYGTQERNFMDISKDTGNAAGESCNGHAYLHSLTGGALWPSMSYVSSVMPGNAAYTPAGYIGSGNRNAVITVTTVSLAVTPGTIVSGRITLYGIAHS